MASPRFEISQASAVAAVQSFDLNASQIKSLMNKGYSSCQEYLRNYKGSQADAFWQLLQQIGTDMSNISKELDQQSQLVHTASRQYTGGDEDASALIRGAGGGAGGGGAISSAL
jgi:uncharacterized protein YukE